jgi:hypothetical protein
MNVFTNSLWIVTLKVMHALKHPPFGAKPFVTYHISQGYDINKYGWLLNAHIMNKYGLGF